ncbi:probable calcium/calmodulin-dependent protein kinase type 1D at C-terminar half [Coccomyxa sp. Obi]|nr:probable calcium/calmodulin-dependent protein kinase type 1D at C-terminar half [Coccomyxa sp. Obi]
MVSVTLQIVTFSSLYTYLPGWSRMNPVLERVQQLTQRDKEAFAECKRAWDAIQKTKTPEERAAAEKWYQICLDEKASIRGRLEEFETRLLDQESAAEKLTASAQPSAAQISPAQVEDTTADYLKEIMATMKDSPPSFNELTDGPRQLSKPLPLTPAGFACIRTFLVPKHEFQSLMILTQECPAVALGESISVGLRRSGIDANGGEHSVVIATDFLVIGLMKDVLYFLNIDEMAENAGNIVDRSGATTGTSRPDALLMLASNLMCKGEVKESPKDLEVAEKELKDKMADWSPLYHGHRTYMICYAAAGYRLRFYAVTRGGHIIKAISPEFNLRSPLDRLKVMHASISVLIIILQQAKHQFPSHRLPFGIRQRYPHSVIYYPGTHVEKTVDLQNFPFADRDALVDVYTVLLALPCGAMPHPRGLIRPLGMPECKYDRWWKVKLPMGLVLPPKNQDILRCLVADILHGLSTLHRHGIVHRDVRHPNILMMADNEHVLIDFEISGRAGKVPPFEPLSHWPPECKKADAPFTPAADIYCVGALMSDEKLKFKLDSDASAFRDHLMAEDPTQRPSASEALRLPWLISAS